MNSVAMNLSDQEAEHLRKMPNSNQTHEKLAQIFSTRPDNNNEVENQIHILNNVEDHERDLIRVQSLSLRTTKDQGSLTKERDRREMEEKGREQRSRE